ncbi:membrane protein insertase YidC [Ktedonosporobacter rubrisoli]|uniref:Membrane protein insertase YidC n=1 Tax=Ktedonosporobacter rubrisoli TaxID=2509675 RepID=A0A4P6JY06_KTERU|nr:YidC/Oxa1 family membrane protein insertase [Ktedonosporobacter rubrisoli]QBD80667.1 membrane protein insertase YidC [Ktedonosporobacter rubrisoli]
MGNLFGPIGYLFNIIFTYPIFNALMLLYHLFGDFGLSIVVLTVAIKLILFPLTLKQLKSMKGQQALQPRMAEIRKKYKDDQQAQMREMQNLYKEFGINPVAGCLPLLVQMPVLYGLFYAINNLLSTTKVEVMNSMLYWFVPHFNRFPNIDLNWFTFLNPAWHFSLGHPDPTHILPILAGVATLIQLRMSQPKGAATSTDSMAQSTKMMQWIMPVFIVFIGWNYSAGLALYWTVSSIFQAVQQYFVTGWGSLMTMPDFMQEKKDTGNKNGRVVDGSVSTSTKNKSEAAAQERERKAVEKTEQTNVDGTGPIGSQLRSSPRNGSSYGRQHQRGRSASARRRGATQRSRS